VKIDGRKAIHTDCNLCGADTYNLLWIKDSFRYVRCVDCGLVYITPRLTEAEIAYIYDLGFESKSIQRPEPIDFSSYGSFFKQISPYRKNNTILDVGCFRGYLLMAAKERSWRVFGTEISKRAAQSASNSGLNVHLGSLPDAHYSENYFDVISLFDVVEHLSDPMRYFREIRRILRPGGLVYLETPNFDSLLRFLFGQNWCVFFPWHLYFFTKNTIEHMIIKAGLQLIGCKCENWGPLSRFNPYSSLNSNFTISKPRAMSSEFVRRYNNILKRPYLWAQSIANIPLRILSRFGFYTGSKLIILAEK